MELTAMGGNSSRRRTLWYNTYDPRTSLSPSQLARPWQMNLRCKGWGQFRACCTSPKKTPLRRLKDKSMSATTNSPKSCSDGKGAKTAGGRCHWKPQSQSCMQTVQDIGRLMLIWRRQHHSAAPWMTKQPSLGIALLAPNGQGPRKGGLNKARLFHTQLACRSQRASSHAAEIQ